LIALDTSAVSRFLDGSPPADAAFVRRSVADGTAVLSPIVLTEVLSRPTLDEEAWQIVLSIPMLPILEGYWARAGAIRAELKRNLFKANLADVLVAQSCIDFDVPLIAYDRDFRHFVSAGLKLL
jgi:predicted nucleic acid-binding protein